MPLAGAFGRSGLGQAEGSPDGGQSLRSWRQGPGQRRRASGRQVLMWAPFAWWNGAGRQRRVGWLIIALSVFYILYFLKARLFAGSAGGGPIMTKEWVYFVLSFVGIML